MGSDERDQQFERALSRHLRNAEQDAACPDPETLAAYHERTLSPEEMARWKEHIAGCARCQEALALVEQSETVVAEGWQGEKALAGERTAEAVPLVAEQIATGQEAAGISVARAKITEIGKSAKLKRWTVPIGAIAATLLVWIGWHELRTTTEKTASSIQVAENREASPPPPQPGALPMNGRSTKSMMELAPGAPAPGREAKTQGRIGESGGGGVGGGAGGGFAPKQEPPATVGGAGTAFAGQDAKNYESDQLSAKMAPAPPPAAPRPAESFRAMTPVPANRGATGGPLVKNQMDQGQANQAQANQTQVNQVPTEQNSEKLAKKEEAQKQERQKQKDQAVSAEASAMSVAVTNDGPISLRDMANITPTVIAAPDNKNAWRVGASGKIEHSGNGGNSWKAQASGVTQDLLAGMAVSKKICWVVGKNGTILLTTDGGRRWAKILSPIKGDLGGVHAQDEQHASVWDVANREAYETSDGGATWKSTANE
jgi:hypothetical protein